MRSCSFGTKEPAEPEVAQLHHARPGYEHVRWLYVCKEMSPNISILIVWNMRHKEVSYEKIPFDLPLCMTLFVCMWSRAEQSWTKYFHTVLSGISFYFMRIINGSKLVTEKFFHQNSSFISAQSLMVGFWPMDHFSILDPLFRLKCLIIRLRSPASASSSTMLSSLFSMKEARYAITFGWFSCWKTS